ncbi:hypothetical protein [Streptomyces sp. AA1529]|uniref:hypothetical protein n=1 Tax=Streptomyces sp. AA1529 TaxID=1203257 RepID=UPI003D707B63
MRVEARYGDAGEDSERVLSEVGAWGHPILGVFYSWGSVNVPLAMQERTRTVRHLDRMWANLDLRAIRTAKSATCLYPH